MPDIILRTAAPGDAAALLAIYTPYVTDTAITFEYEVPSKAAFAERIARTLRRYPYLIAEADGQPLGYAYMGPFVGRAAYDWSAELSIYLRMDARQRGLGRALYTALEAIAQAMGLTNLYACIGVPTGADDAYLTRNSADFHAHLGYRLVGTFQRCGTKFGRWYDMVWMEKIIAPHRPAPAPIAPFPALDAATLRACGIDVNGACHDVERT